MCPSRGCIRRPAAGPRQSLLTSHHGRAPLSVSVRKTAKLHFFSGLRRKNMKDLIILPRHWRVAFRSPSALRALWRRAGRRRGARTRGELQSEATGRPGLLTPEQMCQASFLGFLCVSCLTSQHFCQAPQEMSEVLSSISPFFCPHTTGGASSLPPGGLTKALEPVGFPELRCTSCGSFFDRAAV